MPSTATKLIQLALNEIATSHIPVSVTSTNGAFVLLTKGQIANGTVMIITGRTTVIDSNGNVVYPTTTDKNEYNVTDSLTLNPTTKAVVKAEAVVRLVKHQNATIRKRKDGYDQITIHIPNIFLENACVLCGERADSTDTVAPKTRISYMWTSEVVHRRCVIPCLINSGHASCPFLYNTHATEQCVNYCETCDHYHSPESPVVNAFDRMKRSTRLESDKTKDTRKQSTNVIDSEIYRDTERSMLYRRRYFATKPSHSAPLTICYDKDRRLYYDKEYLPYADY